MNSIQDATIRQFLLGTAGEDELCRVEDAILAGELDISTLQIAEDELIDDFHLGRLTAEERHRYNHSFLVTAERRERHSFALGLIQHLRGQQSVEGHFAERESAKPGTLLRIPAWSRTTWFTAAASVLFSAIAGYEFMQYQRQALLAREAQLQLAQLQKSLSSSRDGGINPAQSSSTAVGDLRGLTDQMASIQFGSASRNVLPIPLHIPKGAYFVAMEVTLPEPLSARYREAVLTQSGALVWSQEFPASSVNGPNRRVSAVPADVLPTALYHFQLEEVSAENRSDEVIDQVFRVERE